MVACCPAAARWGVQIGMPLAEVSSLSRRAEIRSRLAQPDRSTQPLRVGTSDGEGQQQQTTRRQPPLAAGDGGRPGRAPQRVTLHYEPQQVVADRQQLEELAVWCERFSPVVGLEAGDTPEGLLLEVTGLSSVFGSEQQLAMQLWRACRARGYEVRIAIADTIGAAWGVARWGQRAGLPRHESLPAESLLAESLPAESLPAESLPAESLPAESLPAESLPAESLPAESLPAEIAIVCRNQAQSWLSRLPVAALRLSPHTLELLQQLGLQVIGDLFDLPRSSLAARLGPQVTERLDQLLGRQAELIVAHRQQASFEATWHLEHATTRRDELECVVEHLTTHISNQLLAKACGALEIECTFHCPPGRPQVICVGLFEPASDPRRILDLFRMQLETLQLRAATQTVMMRVTSVVRVTNRQYELWEEVFQESGHDLADFIERLSSRLGLDKVLQMQRAASVLPEKAYREKPLAGAARQQGTRPSPRGSSRRRGQRTTKTASSPTARPLSSANPPPSSRPESATSIATEPSAHERNMPAGWHRPLWLTPTPHLLNQASWGPGPQAPDALSSARCDETSGPPLTFSCQGQVHETARHWGPERIETAWWRGRCVRRDYYQLETTAGYRFWIFQNLNDGRWFLHGCFD